MGTPLNFTAVKERKNLRADYLAQTLTDLSQCLEDLHALTDSAACVADIFPLWDETRELENRLQQIRNVAGWRLNELMEKN